MYRHQEQKPAKWRLGEFTLSKISVDCANLMKKLSNGKLSAAQLRRNVKPAFSQSVRMYILTV